MVLYGLFKIKQEQMIGYSYLLNGFCIKIIVINAMLAPMPNAPRERRIVAELLSSSQINVGCTSTFVLELTLFLSPITTAILLSVLL